MAASREELLQFIEEAEANKDFEAASQALDMIEAMGAAEQAPQVQQRETYGDPVQVGEQNQVGEQPKPWGGIFPDFNGVSAVERLISGYADQREALLNNATGAVAATVAPIAAVPQMVMEDIKGMTGQPVNPMIGPQTRDRVTEAMTYQPQTLGGKRIVEGQAELMQPVGEFMEQGRVGNEMLDAGYPEWAARQGEMLPEYAMSALSLGGLKSNPRGTVRGKKAAPIDTKSPMGRIEPVLDVPPTKNAKLGDVLSGTKEAAKARVGPTGQLIKNKAGIKATNAGWGDNVVGHVSSLTKSEKNLYKMMVDSAKKYYSEYAAKGRPSDVVGMEFSKNIQYLKNQKTISGKKLDVIAKDLAGAKVDVSGFVQKLKQDIFELGGKIDDQGKLSFGPDSQLYQLTGDQRALIGLYEKSKGLANANGLQVHQVKKWLDNYIDYGKSINSADNAITKQMQPILKAQRAALNEAVRKVSPAYAKQNDIFSSAAGPLADVQRAMGTTDILSEMAPQFLGQKFRAFLGNNQNRLKIEMAVGEAQEAAKKLGGKFPEHNITAQMRFINDMEKMWGPFTETSFKAEIGQAGTRVMSAPSVTQTGMEAARLTQRQLNKMKVSRQAQIKAMEDLLTQ